jgi:hypothetical protein
VPAAPPDRPLEAALVAVRAVALLARHGVRSRIDDAVGFATRHLVVLLRHDSTGVDLDLSLAWSDFEHAALAARSQRTFGRVRLPMATARSLVVYKAIAGRPRDLQDVEALVALHDLPPEPLRAEVEALAAVAGAPELLDGFDAAVARAFGSKPPPRKR